MGLDFHKAPSVNVNWSYGTVQIIWEENNLKASWRILRNTSIEGSGRKAYKGGLEGAHSTLLVTQSLSQVSISTQKKFRINEPGTMWAILPWWGLWSKWCWHFSEMRSWLLLVELPLPGLIRKDGVERKRLVETEVRKEMLSWTPVAP